MAVAARAADKLDVICIGATLESLFAAASLAASGKHVRVLEPRAPGRLGLDGEPCLVDLEAVAWLDLVSHGLRFGAAAPLIAVTQDRSLAVWPEMDATLAGLAALSARDAAAFPGFVHAITRLANGGSSSAAGGLLNLLALGPSRDPMLAGSVWARATSLSRLLEDAFDSSLVRGLLAQHALERTAVSPTLPGSARLLTRQSVVSLLGGTSVRRLVAGGTLALAAALQSSLKTFATLEVQHEARVRQIVVERDAVQGVVLADGSLLRASQVILGRQGDTTLELLQALPFDVPPGVRFAPSGRINYLVGMPPAVRGIGAGTITSGASILLNPSLERLVRSHGAFEARQLLQDYCLALRVTPVGRGEERMMWQVVADVLFIPRETDEGPWTGPRRERLVSAVTKAIEAWAPGFELSLKGAELVSPAEPRPFLELQRPRSALGAFEGEIPTLPDISHDGVWKVGRGLWLEGESFSGATGRAGLSMAQALGASVRARVSTDA